MIGEFKQGKLKENDYCVIKSVIRKDRNRFFIDRVNKKVMLVTRTPSPEKRTYTDRLAPLPRSFSFAFLLTPSPLGDERTF